jgi:hypothetical protein
VTGTDYIGFKDIPVANPPWVRDANVTHAWSARPDKITWQGSPGGEGSSIQSLAATKSAEPIGSTSGGAVAFHNSLVGLAAQYAQHSSGASAFLVNSPVGAAASGTAVPVSIAIAGKLNAAPNYAGATGAQWVLFAFCRDASVTPFLAVIGSRGSTDCVLQRRNNAGAADTGATLSLGTSPFVLVCIYSGTTFTTRLNGVVIDNAISAGSGGACTLDRFGVGGFRPDSAGGGLYSDLLWTNIIVGTGVAWGSATYKPIETYLRRKLGV